MGGDILKQLKDNSVDKIFIESSHFVAPDATKQIGFININQFNSQVEYYFGTLHTSSDYKKITIYKKIVGNKTSYVRVFEFNGLGEKEAVIICDKELATLVKNALFNLGYNFEKPKSLKK